MHMLDEMRIAQLRADTPGCNHVNHLNNAGAGLMPQPVIAAIQNYIQLEAEIGGYEAEAQKEADLETFYEHLGTFLHAPAAHFAFMHHSTDAYARALSAIPFESGDVILTTINDYSSNQLAFLSLQNRIGIRVIRVPDQETGGVDVVEMERMIQTYRPKLVAVTHVPTNSGLIQEVEAIGNLCAQEDIWYLVDACQSVGQLPVYVNRIQCDFLTASFRKFLRGPRGAGFLYVSPKVLERSLTPLYPDLRSSEWIGADEYVPKPHADRFEYWEQAYALMLGSSVSLQYALELGIENIAQRTQDLADYTRKGLMSIPPCKILDQGAALCGIVSFTLPLEDPSVLKNHLQQRKINTAVGVRQNALIDFDRKAVSWAMRISPHYYNTYEEIDVFLDVLAKWIKTQTI